MSNSGNNGATNAGASAASCFALGEACDGFVSAREMGSGLKNASLNTLNLKIPPILTVTPSSQFSSLGKAFWTRSFRKSSNLILWFSESKAAFLASFVAISVLRFVL